MLKDPGSLKIGDVSEGVRVIQYYLDYIATFVPTVSRVEIDGIFGEKTRDSVLSFQKTYGINENGEVNRDVFAKMQNVYYGLLLSNASLYQQTDAIPFPGRILRQGIRGDDVRLLQKYLIEINKYYKDIPLVVADGIFGQQTELAVKAFQNKFSLAVRNGRVNAITWDAIVSVYEDLIIGERVNIGQFPGYTIGD